MSDSKSIYHSIAGLIFPSGLLEYFDVVNVEERSIPECERKGLESGELIFLFEEKDVFRNPEPGHTYRPNGFYEQSNVRDFPLRDKKSPCVSSVAGG